MGNKSSEKDLRGTEGADILQSIPGQLKKRLMVNLKRSITRSKASLGSQLAAYAHAVNRLGNSYRDRGTGKFSLALHPQ